MTPGPLVQSRTVTKVRPLLILFAITGIVTSLFAQGEPPVFRADAYVIAIDYAPLGGAPMVGLTSADFTVTIDKRIMVPVKVIDDATRPGVYRITFSPPESLRDGKKHRVDVVRTNKKPVRFQLLFEKPKKPD
jgi:hypothetical protein